MSDRYVCMRVCTKSFVKTTTNSLCVCAHLANKADSHFHKIDPYDWFCGPDSRFSRVTYKNYNITRSHVHVLDCEKSRDFRRKAERAGSMCNENSRCVTNGRPSLSLCQLSEKGRTTCKTTRRKQPTSRTTLPACLRAIANISGKLRTLTKSSDGNNRSVTPVPVHHGCRMC